MLKNEENEYQNEDILLQEYKMMKGVGAKESEGMMGKIQEEK